MKFYLILTTFFLTTLFLSFTISAQTKPDSLAAPAAPKGRDFNYTFCPNDVYSRVGNFWRVDSTTLAGDGKTITPTLRQFTDTSSAKLQVLVEHQGEQLTIRSLLDQTQIHYREAVRFIGVTDAPTSALAYQALSKTNEMVYVNPVTGYVVIIFNVPLASNPKLSNVNMHYFGNIPTGSAATPRK